MADEPEKLDGSLVGENIYLRWERYGWQFGKITAEGTKATPQLSKKSNFRVTWQQGAYKAGGRELRPRLRRSVQLVGRSHTSVIAKLDSPTCLTWYGGTLRVATLI